MKVLILAGGSGTRLWPLSRAASPKQVQPFLDNRTLLQHTWRRLRQSFSASDLFVATTAAQARLVRSQLPQLRAANMFIEPVGRNTAPAICFAVRVFAQRFPGQVVATVNSDHHIGNAAAYLRALRLGGRVVQTLPDHIVLLGVRPTYAETGYGYIEVGARLGRAHGARTVKRFTEKPSPLRAERYLRSGRYLWNSGLFIFYPERLLSLVQAHAPRLAAACNRLAIRRGRQGYQPGALFSRLPAVSLDYAVLEHSATLAVLPASFSWSDVGHWKSVYDILRRSAAANVSRGTHLGLSSSGNLIYAPKGKLVATVGLTGTVVVDTGDALLVCPREFAQDVRHVVAALRRQPKLRRYL